MDEYKKTCAQVHIPVVDNTSPCDEFMYSQCVIVNRRSPVLKNPTDSDLNTYHELLDKKLMQLNNMLIQIKNEQQVMMNLINVIQNGDVENIGTWAPGD